MWSFCYIIWHLVSAAIGTALCNNIVHLLLIIDSWSTVVSYFDVSLATNVLRAVPSGTCVLHKIWCSLLNAACFGLAVVQKMGPGSLNCIPCIAITECENEMNVCIFFICEQCSYQLWQYHFLQAVRQKGNNQTTQATCHMVGVDA
jgi:hypothetical protein